MTIAVAFQMDPLAGLNPKGDTTYGLMSEALRLGHTVWTYQPHDLSQEGKDIFATMRKVENQNGQLQETVAQTHDLRTMDVVWLRQDPPFDMAYMTTTYLLEQVMDTTLVVNNPIQVRNCPEKIFVHQFADLMPPTLISRNMDAMRTFRDKHHDIVIKPLYGFGGGGVFRLTADDPNFDSVVETLLDRDREPMVAQAFLPDVRAGDKRVILVDGVPCGALNRVPADGHIRSNLAVGGRGELSELTQQEQDICNSIGPELKRRGLVLVGIDVIGGLMTEINVTSPTGPVVIRDLGGPDALAATWDAIAIKL